MTVSKNGHHASAIIELPVKRIRVGNRHRTEMGDLRPLARSIEQEGLLQPIGVTQEHLLVFGERRLRAIRDVLKRSTIPARIVNVSSIVAGEYAENEVRKDFTPSERVAIAQAVQRYIGNRQGQRTDRQPRQKSAEVPPGKTTRCEAARRAGFGNHETFRQATKVVEKGGAKLILAMDEGRVSISAAALLADANLQEQEAIVDLDPKAILAAAKEIRRQQIASRVAQQQKAERKAQAKLGRRRTWTITTDQRVVPCDLLLVDPPYGLTKEPWTEAPGVVHPLLV